MELDLNLIRDILAFQRLMLQKHPKHMSKAEDVACKLFIEAIDEGRVQIVAKRK